MSSLLAAAYVATGVCFWFHLVGKRLSGHRCDDYLALLMMATCWPLAWLYMKGYSRGLDAGHKARDTGGQG